MSALYSLDELTFTGTVTMDGAAINEAEEVEASASATTNIGQANSNNVRIAGEATITAFDSVPEGIVRLCRFTGTCTLTHNATSLVLPGGANITTQPGDAFVAESFGGGNWKVLIYQPAAGVGPKAAITGGTLDSVTITNSTLIADPSGLKVEDPSQDDTLSIATTELTADRTFTIDPDDGNRVLTVSADVALDQNITTTSNPQFATVNVGHASDTTISRVSGGVLAVEGVNILASNASGVQTFLTTPSSANLAAAVTDEVGTGSLVFGNQAVSAGSNPEFATVNIGNASDTTVSRVSGGVLAVEGVNILASNASGVQTFLTTPSSANLAAAVTDEIVGTGGKLLFGDQEVSTDDNVQHATLGLGGARTDGVLHINPGAAGTATANGVADELVVECADDGGITILTPDDHVGRLYFGGETSNQHGTIYSDYTANTMLMRQDRANGRLVLGAGGNLYGEVHSAPSSGVAGWTLHASGVTPQHDGVLHVMSGTAGSVTAHSNADDLIVEGAANTGISILTPNANTGSLYFGTASDDRGAWVAWDYTTNNMQIATDKAAGFITLHTGTGSEMARFDGTVAHLGAHGGTVTSSGIDAGVRIYGGSADNSHLILSNADVAHGLTSAFVSADTSDILHIRKRNVSLGGVAIHAFMEDAADVAPLHVSAIGGTANTGFSTAKMGTVTFDSWEHGGSNNYANFAANSVVFAVRTGDNGGAATSRFLIDVEGDVAWDGTNTTFDAHNDNALVTTFNEFLGVDRSGRPDWSRMSKLMDLKLIGRVTPEEWEAGARPLVVGSKVVALHNGWMVQAHERERIRDQVIGEMLEDAGLPGYLSKLEQRAVGRNVGGIPALTELQPAA